MTRDSADPVSPNNVRVYRRIGLTSDQWSYGLIIGAAIAMTVILSSDLRMSFWRDEAATATTTSRSPIELLRMFGRAEGGISGYLSFIRIWSVLGQSEWILRLPSLFAAAAAVIAIGVVAKRIAGPLAGVMAALLLACHPVFMPYFALEARPYTLGAALGAGAAIIAFDMSRRLTRHGPIIWSLLASVAISFHLLSLLGLLPQLLWIWTARRTHPATKLRLAVAGPALTTLLVASLAARVTVLQSWIPSLSKRTIWQEGVLTISTGMLVALAATTPGLVALLRERRPLPGASVDRLVVAGWAAIPAVGLVAMSVLGTPALIGRYMLASVTGTCVAGGLLIAAACDGIRHCTHVVWKFMALGCLIFGLLYSLVLDNARGAFHATRKTEDLRSAAQWVLEKQRLGDAILYAPSWAEVGMRWYLQGGGQPFPVDLTAKRATSAIDANDLFTPEVTLSDAQAALLTHDRIWIVGYGDNSNWEPVPELGIPLARDIRDCWARADSQKFGIMVELWVRNSNKC